MKEKIEKLIKTVQTAMGDHCIGVIDQSELNGQLAFVTDAPDGGEHDPGPWLDVVVKAVAAAGIRHAPVMPFPTRGKLMYVVAGLKRSC